LRIQIRLGQQNGPAQRHPEQELRAHGPDVLGESDLADYRRIETFRTRIPDLLRLVKDIARPSTFEKFVDHSFADLVAREKY
jgi:hypothetical protein